MSEISSRKANWTDQELSTLVEAIQPVIHLINGKFSIFLTHEKKRRCWETVTERVNAVSLKDKRTVEEVKKKWQWAVMSVKKLEAARRQASVGTGGGAGPCDLKPWQRTVLTTIPNSSVGGIMGGIDTGMHTSVENRASQGQSISCEDTSVLCDAQVHVEEDNENNSHAENGESQSDATVPSISSSLEKNKDNTADDCMSLKKKTSCSSHASGSNSDKGRSKNLSQKRGINIHDDTQQRKRFLEIEEEKLLLEKEVIALKKRKVELLEDSIRYQKRTAVALETLLTVIQNSKIDDIISENIFEY